MSEAIVLKKVPLGDCDNRYVLFTRRFGKLAAKAKSARKITSKLAGHLEPGNVIRVRLIEKSGLQIVDALKETRLGVSPENLSLFSDILPDGEAEQALWANCRTGVFAWRGILRTLGWDPEYAACTACDSPKVFSFHGRSQEFFCRQCTSKLDKGGIILMEDG